jgi:hypothetical protein
MDEGCDTNSFPGSPHVVFYACILDHKERGSCLPILLRRQVFSLTKTSCCVRNPCPDAARSGSSGLHFSRSDESVIEWEVWQKNATMATRSCVLHCRERRFPRHNFSDA